LIKFALNIIFEVLELFNIKIILMFDEKGILRYNANITNPFTYTDLGITAEPKDDLDPKPATSDQVGIAVFGPPYGK
jgi:hypothetical protein